MKNSEYTKLAAGLTAIGMSLFASGAWADPNLPGLENQNFTQYTGSAPKGYFHQRESGRLDLVAATLLSSHRRPLGTRRLGRVYLTTYGNPVRQHPRATMSKRTAIRNTRDGFNYTVSGLTVGETYTLSFYQGASSADGRSIRTAPPNQCGSSR